MVAKNVVVENGPWDVIVIGGGLAGCISARELIAAGLRVLVLEAGRPAVDDAGGGEAPIESLVQRLAGRLRTQSSPFRPDRWPEHMTMEVHQADGNSFRNTGPAMMGTGPGGSSLIYGGALNQFEREDFELDDSSARGGLPNDWPVEYGRMEGLYAEAATLMGVTAGNSSSSKRDGEDFKATLAPRDRELVGRLRENGRQPYRLPVGISYLPGCDECLGVRCARACRSDGFRQGLAPLLSRPNLVLETDATVAKIEDNGGLIAVHARKGERTCEFHARHIVMAAGALNTPRILFRSPSIWKGRAPHHLLGRGLMFHGLDIFAVANKSAEERGRARKTLAVRDHYRDCGEPLGEIQSFALAASTNMVAHYLMEAGRRKGFGQLGPLLQLARIPALFAHFALRNTTLFATILEDFPYAHNRLLLGNEKGIDIEYHVTSDLIKRSRRFRALVRECFAPRRVVFLTLEGTLNWGHPCGTCRMGRDSGSSVVDASGRLWANDRVSVVDASTFASSAGTNPGLTVVANALRISRTLAVALKRDPPTGSARSQHTAKNRSRIAAYGVPRGRGPVNAQPTSRTAS